MIVELCFWNLDNLSKDWDISPSLWACTLGLEPLVWSMDSMDDSSSMPADSVRFVSEVVCGINATVHISDRGCGLLMGSKSYNLAWRTIGPYLRISSRLFGWHTYDHIKCLLPYIPNCWIIHLTMHDFSIGSPFTTSMTTTIDRSEQEWPKVRSHIQIHPDRYIRHWGCSEIFTLHRFSAQARRLPQCHRCSSEEVLGRSTDYQSTVDIFSFFNRADKTWSSD